MESLYEEAKTQAGDLDEDDIQKLIEKGDYDPYFENKTTRMVIEEVQQELYQANIENIETSLKKLIGYRYIDEVSDLLRGRHVKWMNLTKQKKGIVDIFHKGLRKILNMKPRLAKRKPEW